MINYIRLGDVSKIEISSVDKKIKENESKVKLCNFTDVYKNWAINKDMIPTFTMASATSKEKQRFELKKGQVAITKDSETRDDIGMATYIADSLENVLLGYHCALITPNQDVIYGKYLNAYMNSKCVRKHYENQASGSGQRYTLTIDAISNIKIPLIEYTLQQKIGDFFSNIDKKITLNNQINLELESLAKTIYDYWFLQFDFPDENGKPYKTSGGKMVWNEEVKREIPEGWTIEQISNISNLYQPKTISEKDLDYDGQYYVYGANGIIGKYTKYNHLENEIAICCRGASCGLFLMTQPKSWITGNSMVVSPTNKQLKEYIYYNLNAKVIGKYITGSAQPQITATNLAHMKIIIPDNNMLKRFNSISLNIRKEIELKFNETQSLIKLRDFLLPLLMNEQVGFKEE